MKNPLKAVLHWLGDAVCAIDEFLEMLKGERCPACWHPEVGMSPDMKRKCLKCGAEFAPLSFGGGSGDLSI